MRVMLVFLLSLPIVMTISAQDFVLKPYPAGIYESGGPIRNADQLVTTQTVGMDGQDGILVRVMWNLCDDDCVIQTIIANLDDAEARGLQVALAVSDGHNVPDGIKDACTLFTEGEFRGEPISFCLPWDEAYVEEKVAFIARLGAAVDQHPALSYMYFTGACSTNGFEGHCRVDEAAFSNSGYTPERLAEAYIDVMDAYVSAFPATPIVFEVHTLFDDEGLVWQSVWDAVRETGRVGVAAWWCSEHLSVNGRDTLPVWSIVQDAAAHTFSVCQTLGNFSEQPFRFTNASVGLDYGVQADSTTWDSALAFQQTFDWIDGIAVHAGQGQTITPFAVVEVWTQDLRNADFQPRLAGFGRR